MSEVFDVVVIGAGAAGIGAGRRLAKAGASFLLVEARDRIGGRAWTIGGEWPVDLGCGWLHSGDVNVMTAIAEAMGLHVNRTPAPWQRQSEEHEIKAAEQARFRESFSAFEARIEALAEKNPPVAASAYLEPGNPSNALIDAVFGFISGASLDQIDARDYARYQDTGVNWRVSEGYGALFAKIAAPLPVRMATRARSVRARVGGVVRVESDRGVIEARSVIVTAPTSTLARIEFEPALGEKIEAAAALPMGAAEKLYFALAQPEEFLVDSHLFPRADNPVMGSYHMRPMGRPLIEAFFGGDLARGLAEAGTDAMTDYAREELAGLLGSNFPSRLTFIAASSWARDADALGSYSYAKPGFADMRAVLAEPRPPLFFAGEACSRARYSTAHGAFETGHDAAEQALAFLGYSEPSPRA